MKKTIIFLIFFVAFFLIIVDFFYLNREGNFHNQFLETKSSTGKITVFLKIDNQTNYEKIVADQNRTALDLLTTKAQVAIQGKGANAFVTTINGKKADTAKRQYWAFYVNNQQSIVGAGSYQLKDGDKIEWKIEKY